MTTNQNELLKGQNESRANTRLNNPLPMKLIGIIISLLALGSFGRKRDLRTQGERSAFSQACPLGGSHNGLSYLFTESGAEITLTITGTGNGDGSVPSVLSGEHWRQDEQCFQSITKIVLTGVTTVEANAFTNLEKLKSLESDSLQTVGESAFAGATSLSELKAPNIATLGNRCFQNTASLAIDLELGSLSANGESAFEGSGILSVSVPKANFVRAAYRNCRSLTAYKVGRSNLLRVPESVFEGCSSLTSITGINWDGQVYPRAFCGCSLLTNFQWKNCYNYQDSSFEGCGFEVLDLANSRASRWGIGTFKNCVQLKEVKMTGTGPDGLNGLMESSFEGCTSLTTLSYPGTSGKNIGFIEKRAFFGCSQLSVCDALKRETKSIGDSAFEGTALTTIDLNIPTSLTMGISVFRNCPYLQSCTLHRSMTSLPEATFDQCVSLKDVTSQNPITSFGARALCGCSLFANNAIIGASSTQIGASAFEGTSITT